MNYSIFRAYDIRGVYPGQINEGVVYRIARNANNVFKKGSCIIIGHDARSSSPVLYQVLALGLRVAGMKVIRGGFMSTPMLTFMVRTKKAGGGMMITASHNPPEYNGIKVVDKDGIAIGGDVILRRIGKRALDVALDVGRMVSVKTPYSGASTDFLKDYGAFIARYVALKRPVRVVLDCSNGAVGPVWEASLQFLSEDADIIAINNDPDGSFPAHGPNPLAPGALKQASLAVLEHNADMGVVFDGDGDRAIFLDEKGKQIRSEYIARLLWAHTKAHKCVYDEESLFLTARLAENMREKLTWPMKLYRSKVGHSFVAQAMKKYYSVVGFEFSGHYYFKEFWHADSGIMASALVMSAVSHLPYSLNTFVSLLPRTSRAREKNIVLKDQTMNRLITAIRTHFKSRAKNISTYDGISVYMDNAWCNVRASNTQPIVRINVEAETKEKESALSKELEEVISKVIDDRR